MGKEGHPSNIGGPDKRNHRGKSQQKTHENTFRGFIKGAKLPLTKEDTIGYWPELGPYFRGDPEDPFDLRQFKPDVHPNGHSPDSEL